MREHKNKIYYSSGLISIILLPLLCIIYLRNIDAFTNYGYIKLDLWNGKDFNTETTEFLNSKRFNTINLTGNPVSDSEKLNLAEKRIRELISSKDSINGLKFHFEKKSEYWTFVKVIDILESEKAKFYLPYKNDIWFANPREPKKKIKTFVCGTIYSTVYIDENEPITEFQNVITIIKKYYLSIIAYVLMVFFTFRRMRLKN